MNSQRVHLYCRDTIGDLPWPNTPEADFAKRFLIPFVGDGPSHYIDNALTTMYALTVDDLVLPVSVSDGREKDNSWTCSTYSQYVSAFRGLLGKKAPLLGMLLKPLLWKVRGAFRLSRADRVVTVNHWLTSTNPYPKLTPDQLRAIREFLVKRFPDHAILFRSVNRSCYEDLYQGLVANGFDVFYSRPVLMVRSEDVRATSARMFKSDLKLLKASPYEIVDGDQLAPDEISQLPSLYEGLFIEKHNTLNPQLNLRFFELAVKQNLLRIKAWRLNGRIDAVLGYWHQDGVAHAPVFGYNTQICEKVGLYRQITTLMTLEAQQQGLTLNASSGASSFKLLRRAVPEIEYHAAYCRHLPFHRQAAWRGIAAITRPATWFIGKHLKKI